MGVLLMVVVLLGSYFLQQKAHNLLPPHLPCFLIEFLTLWIEFKLFEFCLFGLALFMQQMEIFGRYNHMT